MEEIKKFFSSVNLVIERKTVTDNNKKPNTQKCNDIKKKELPKPKNTKLLEFHARIRNIMKI